MDVRAPSQTFGIRIPMGGLWTFVSLTAPQVILKHTKAFWGITQVEGEQGARLGRRGSSKTEPESLKETQS